MHPTRWNTIIEGRRSCLQEHSDSVHQFRAIWGLWVFHLVRGHLANARGLAENLLALAHREQSSDLLIEAHRDCGYDLFLPWPV